MTDIQLIVTNAGRTALVNAQHTGTNPIIISHCGVSADAITPHPDITTLPNEVKRISAVSGEAVADDMIHLMIRDDGGDNYTVRSLAFYLDDGTLFAIYGQAAVIVEKSANSMMLLAVDLKFADIAAVDVAFGDTNFLHPPATKTMQGVVELATEAEALAGNDDVRALTPKGNKAAFNNWLDSRIGSAAPSTLVKEILALTLAAEIRQALGLKNAALKNEGTGGGLDADLLDGQHGAYYADIPARLGFTPLNATAYTAADVLAKLRTVDGAGSGLDADLLDGQQASYFTNIIARLGFTPLNALAYTAADVLSKLLSVDGAGSGVDADLLDGQHGSFYQSVEPGSLAFFPFSPIPSTYLIADGSAHSRTTEARLFERIGTTYGAGNGSTTFNLPNYCGEFLRGWDNGRGVDAGRTLGSHQMDAMQELKGRIAGMGRGNFSATGNTGVFGGQGQGVSTHSDGTNISARANLDFDASLVARTANETRPRNVSVIIGIRR